MPIQKYNIFIAGSKDLQFERNLCRVVFSQKQANTGIMFNVKSFEDFPATFIPGSGVQVDYNMFIKEVADLVVFVFDGKVGSITMKEFDIAYRQLQERNHPQILVFCCVGNGFEQSPAYAELRVKLNGLNQYYIDYHSNTDLQLQLNKQIDFYVESHEGTTVLDYSPNATGVVSSEGIESTGEEDFGDDLDYEDAEAALAIGHLEDALLCLVESFSNGNPKAELLINRILFINFGKKDWCTELWEFFEKQLLWKKSFAYMAYFYKYISSKETHKVALEYLTSVKKADKRMPYFFLCDGLCYFYGWGYKADYRTASRRFMKARELGADEAISYIAETMLMGHDNQAIDKEGARNLLNEGMSVDDPRSYLVMAKNLANGVFASTDSDADDKMFLKAAELGMSEAWIELGNNCAKIWAMGNNFEMALKYYTNALKAGIREAHTCIAKLYLNKEDYDRAIQEAQRGVSEGCASSASLLGSIFEKGTPDMSRAFSIDYITNYPEAWRYYQEAYRLGGRIEDAISQARLFVKKEYRPDNVTWDDIKAILIEGAKRPFIEAIELLVAALKMNGEDYKEYLKLGADCGSLPMMYEYAVSGIDTGESLQYLEKSADKNYIPSIKRLMDICKESQRLDAYYGYMKQLLNLGEIENLEEYTENFYKHDVDRLKSLLTKLISDYLNGGIEDESMGRQAIHLYGYYIVNGLKLSNDEIEQFIVNAVNPNLDKLLATDTDFYDVYLELMVLCNMQTEAEAFIAECEHSYTSWIGDYLRCKFDIMMLREVELERLKKIIDSAISVEWKARATQLRKDRLMAQNRERINIAFLDIKENYIRMYVESRMFKTWNANSIDELAELCQTSELSVVFVDYDSTYHDILPQLKELKDKYKIVIVVLANTSHSDEERFMFFDCSYSSSFLMKHMLTDAILINEANRLDYNDYVRSIKILIVDDVPLNLLIIKKMISEIDKHLEGNMKCKCEVQYFTATNGILAIDCLEKESPDIILLDLLMPVMDGFEVIEIIRKNKELSSVPIIVLSALNCEEDITRALKLGANDFINKPVIIDKLISSITQQIILKSLIIEYRYDKKSHGVINKR